MGIKTATKNDEYKITARSTDIFSDFHHTFLPHPNTGQISRKVNVDAVKLALRNLILTNKYERLRNPEFGGNINRYLFELSEQVIEGEIKDHIEHIVNKYEPRVQLVDITVNAEDDDHAVYVRIEFYIVNSKEPEEVELTLYRVR